MIPTRARLTLSGWLADRAKLEDRVASGRIDKVIQRGVCRHTKVLSKGRSTHALRGKKRPQDILDHAPTFLWGQFLGGKRLAAVTQAQDSFARRTQIVYPAAHTVSGNQKATPLVFVEIHRQRPRLSRLA